MSEIIFQRSDWIDGIASFGVFKCRVWSREDESMAGFCWSAAVPGISMGGDYYFKSPSREIAQQACEDWLMLQAVQILKDLGLNLKVKGEA